MLVLFGAVAVVSLISVAAGVFLLTRGFEPGLVPLVIGVVLIASSGTSTALVRRSLRFDTRTAPTGR
jgi:hypothetical protein